jgi:hypothetical protein
VEELGELLAEAQTREQRVIDLIVDYGSIDGADHKQWVLDQIVRVIAGVNYDAFVETYMSDEDGMIDWDRGIAP